MCINEIIFSRQKQTQKQKQLRLLPQNLGFAHKKTVFEKECKKGFKKLMGGEKEKGLSKSLTIIYGFDIETVAVQQPILVHILKEKKIVETLCCHFV